MIYRARDLKNWDTMSSKDGKQWLPARPMRLSGTRYVFYKLKIAYFVFIGRYDALDWEETKTEKAEGEKE